MTRVGVTGHQNLPAEAITPITTAVHAILADASSPLIGYSSLAEGADQLFATLVLNARGTLHAVIPSAGYDSTFDIATLPKYRALLAAADAVTQLPFDKPQEAAYDAAGRYVVDSIDILIAIWDGKAARGVGGTADAVAYAQAKNVLVHVIWPEGLVRE
jgi:hypothetical protein